MLQLAKEIVAGRRLTAEDDLTRLIIADLSELCQGADLELAIDAYKAMHAAGRSYFEDGGEILFRSGANATLTGDMLTTVGNNTAQDREMLNRLGFKIKNNNNNKEEVEK